MESSEFHNAYTSDTQKHGCDVLGNPSESKSVCRGVGRFNKEFDGRRQDYGDSDVPGFERMFRVSSRSTTFVYADPVLSIPRFLIDMPTFKDFPPELTLQIFPHLPLKGLIAAQGVCRQWKEFVAIADIWGLVLWQRGA